MVNPNSSDFKQRVLAYSEEVDRFYSCVQQAINPEDEKAKQKLSAAGKLTTTQRLEYLIDPGAPLLEIAPLAGDSIRVAISLVAGRACMIIANNPTVKGGTYRPLTVKKHIRGQEIARKEKLPCIYLVDSGGAFLPEQKDVFPDRFHFGRIFYNQAQMSKEGIAQISVVLGSCTAGGAYIPSMSDETIMVENNGTVFLGGPPLVKAATGEEVDAETLGGARMHCSESGVSDYLAKNEAHAFELCRKVISQLPENKLNLVEDYQPPEKPAEELYGLLGISGSEFIDAHEILKRFLDAASFHEFKPLYGKTLVCGFGLLCGQQIGVIINNGVLFSESALKGAHFIQLCEQRGVPLLFMHNVMGFMVGAKYERGGIAKDGAKLVKAVSCATVPKISLIIGGSYGAGNYGMCGRAFDPDFLFTWPTSHISVMGGKQAASVLATVKFGDNSDSKEAKAFRANIEEKYEQESNAIFASSQLWDDGILDPARTREPLAFAFSLCSCQESTGRFGVFRF